MGSRVRETFWKAIALSTVVMVCVTAFLQWRPEVLVAFFTPEAEAQAVGATFLRIISWTFIAQGIVFTCSGMFQGLGNTVPAMLSSAIRLGVFVPLAVWVSSQPNFHLDEVWWLSVATVCLQAVVSFVLLQHQFKRRLVDVPLPATPPIAPAPAKG
jgi:Na+-driven multidrug efflux pump